MAATNCTAVSCDFHQQLEYGAIPYTTPSLYPSLRYHVRITPVVQYERYEQEGDS